MPFIFKSYEDKANLNIQRNKIEKQILHLLRVMMKTRGLVKPRTLGTTDTELHSLKRVFNNLSLVKTEDSLCIFFITHFL